jgi:hypothetical protein
MRRLATTVALVLALVAVAHTAFAKPAAPPPPAPTLTCTSAPIVETDPSVATFSGANFPANARIVATVTDPDGAQSRYMEVGNTDGSGAITFSVDLGTHQLGTWTVSAYHFQTLKKIHFLASATTSIVAAP